MPNSAAIRPSSDGPGIGLARNSSPSRAKHCSKPPGAMTSSSRAGSSVGFQKASARHAASTRGRQRAPSLYVYFERKHALYDAMFADGCRQFVARIDATPTGGDPRGGAEEPWR